MGMGLAMDVLGTGAILMLELEGGGDMYATGFIWEEWKTEREVAAAAAWW